MICIKALEVGLWLLKYVPDRFKTREMCDDVVQKRSRLLRYVPGWFVSQESIKLWHDDTYYCNDDDLIKWYEDHQKRKAQKSKIKDELMPIAWHP